MFSILKEETLHVIYEGLLFAMFFLPDYSFNPMLCFQGGPNLAKSRQAGLRRDFILGERVAFTCSNRELGRGVSGPGLDPFTF